LQRHSYYAYWLAKDSSARIGCLKSTNKVVIVGASVSGHDIALRLRERDKDCSITLISDENYPPYDHFKLIDFISGIIQEKDIFLCSEELYKQQNINFLKGRKAGSLNTQKKLVYFKDKGSISYDILVIASGRSPVLPEIPGARKEGVFRLYALDDARELLKRYFTETVCVVGEDAFALRIAESINEKYKVGVKLLSKKVFDPGLIPKDVEVIDDSVAEIIGEGEAQAVKLASGKAIAISAVIFMGNYKSNLEFLKNTEVAVKDDLVVVNSFMQATVENIFACGSVVRRNSVVISIMLVDNIIRQIKGEAALGL